LFVHESIRAAAVSREFYISPHPFALARYSFLFPRFSRPFLFSILLSPVNSSRVSVCSCRFDIRFGRRLSFALSLFSYSLSFLPRFCPEYGVLRTSQDIYMLAPLLLPCLISSTCFSLPFPRGSTPSHRSTFPAPDASHLPCGDGTTWPRAYLTNSSFLVSELCTIDF